VERLEAGLENLAALILRDLGLEVGTLPGGGAAGGFGAGAVAFLGGDLVSGVDEVAGLVRLDEALHGAEWVVTGEGRLDSQSLEGKVVSGVVSRARRLGCRVAVLAGSVVLDRKTLATHGIRAARSVAAEEPVGALPGPVEARHQVRRAARLLARDMASVSPG